MRLVRTAQPPQGIFTPNFQSWQSDGLVFWMPGLASKGANNCRDLISPAVGTWYNAPSWVPDSEMGWALQLQGTNAYADYVDFGDFDKWDGMQCFTITAWVKPLAQTGYYPRILEKSGAFYLATQNGSNGDLFVGVTTDGSSPSMITAYGAMTLNAWNHVSLYWDGTYQILYVNGIFINSSTGSGSIAATANTFYIGRGTGGGDNYNGYLADIRIYSRPLKSDELRDLYLPGTRWDLYRPKFRSIGGSSSAPFDLSVNVSPTISAYMVKGVKIT